MSYASERTQGTQIQNITEAQFKSIFKALGATNLATNIFNNNNTFEINGTQYQIKNTGNTGAIKSDIGYTGYSAAEQLYNLYDVLAIAKDAGYSDKQIADAINNAKIPDNNVGTGTIRMSESAVKSANSNTVPKIGAIATNLNKQYPGFEAYVETTMKNKSDSSGVIYTYTLYYKIPGTNEYTNVEIPSEVVNNGNVNDATVNAWLTQNQLGPANIKDYKASNANADAVDKNIKNTFEEQKKAAQVFEDMLSKANNAQSALGGNVGSNVAYRDVTQSDLDAIKSAEVDLTTKQGYQATKDADILGTIANNFKVDNGVGNSDLLERASLKELQGLTNITNAETVDTNLRKINTARAKLLKEINNDPELYKAIVQQLRADSAAGTIAGQRAANVDAVAREYGEQVSEKTSKLYDSLFNSENNLISSTRNAVMKGRTEALDAYIKEMLNNASQDALAGRAVTTDLGTAVNAWNEVIRTDVSKHANESAEASAAADIKAQNQIGEMQKNVDEGLATEDAKLQYILDNLGLTEDTLAQGAAQGADVKHAVNTITNAVQNGLDLSKAAEYIKAPEYVKATQLDNQHYEDVVNNPIYQNYLKAETIDALTKNVSLDDIKDKFGLDFLDESGMRALYEGYAGEANKDSNKVFNTAQRAYLAAIAAGDAKTTEQLTRLATTHTGSKRNLYAASALSNQFNQQFNNGGTGLQLASDYQNQMSDNRKAVAQAQLAANQALTGYVGSGSDNVQQGTLYGAYNQYATNAANNRQLYGELGVNAMQAIQSMNTDKVNQNIADFERYANLTGETNKSNMKIYINKVGNDAARAAGLNKAQAMGAYAQSQLDDIANGRKFV